MTRLSYFSFPHLRTFASQALGFVPNWAFSGLLLSLLLGLVLSLFSWGGEAWAAAESTLLTQTVEPADYLGKIMLSLVFILMIIFVLAWLLKRFGSFSGMPNVNMKILGALSVGQKERVVLLQVGKEQLVIGVTPAEITLLHQMQEPIEVEEAKPVQGAFAQRLQEAMAKQRGGTKNKPAEPSDA